MQWVRRYLKFHRDQTGAWRHPREMGATEVVAFLNHLANVERVAAATQNQALNALSFLYTQVLGLELGDLGEFLRASKPRRVPDKVQAMLVKFRASQPNGKTGLNRALPNSPKALPSASLPSCVS